MFVRGQEWNSILVRSDTKSTCDRLREDRDNRRMDNIYLFYRLRRQTLRGTRLEDQLYIYGTSLALVRLAQSSRNAKINSERNVVIMYNIYM